MKALEQLAPLHMAESWDNCGLLVGAVEKEVKSIYVALDATDKVLSDAIDKEVDLVITHHPLILKGLKKITDEDFISRRIQRMIRHDINHYAMHTNFDVTVMADLAADYLALTNQEVLEKIDETHGLGKIGTLPKEMNLKELCEYVKTAFSLEHVKVFQGKETTFKKVAIMPGSGKGYIQNTIQSQVDVMITGDIDHHNGIDAVAEGLVIIDAGHYGIEHIFVAYMEKWIISKFPEIKVYTEETHHPFQIF